MKKKNIITCISILSILAILFCVIVGNLIVNQAQKKDIGEIDINEFGIPLSESAIGFLHTNGTEIVDENGNPYRLKGIAFGNNVWDRPTVPSTTDHTEDSYAEIAELGFNSVRFYLNYQLFEDDSSPYVYREATWEWLDQEVALAKKYGIRLILNMHIPHGEKQSVTNDMSLWTDKELQQRFIRLWAEIARRYHDEETIIGYGLLNEPRVPKLGTTNETFMQWGDLAQRTVDAVREEDTKHIVFIEKICGVIDMSTGKTVETDWDDSLLDFVLIKDDNVAYEYHFYSLTEFTHQGLSWLDYKREVRYNNESGVQITGNTKYITETKCKSPYDTMLGGWQYIESDVFQVSNDNITVAYTNLGASYLGSNGRAYFDDVIVSEYDEKGNFVGIVYSNSFDTQFWYSMYQPRNKSGVVAYDAAIGYTDAGSMMISRTIDKANASDGYFSTKKFFSVKQGYSYKVSAYVLSEGSEEKSVIQPMITFCSCTGYTGFNYDYIERSILKYCEFSAKNNVPIYLGEFAAAATTFTKAINGAGWVRDVIRVLNNNSMSYCYHIYHEEPFGLYMNSPRVLPDERNNILYQIFQDYVR